MSATAILHPPTPTAHSTALENPLPQILHTPAGLALLEIQGTINLPHRDEDQTTDPNIPDHTPIGRLVFPGYNPNEALSTWTKTVHMYVGQHQRLTGEVKKLPKAIAIIRKKNTSTQDEQSELDIVEIVKWKILFSQRPEPVGTWSGEE